jgi:acyl carrier protein
MGSTAFEIRRLIEARSGKVVSPGDVLADALNLDSLAMVELAISIERRFGIAISDRAAEAMHTLDDLIAYVDGRVGPTPTFEAT